MLRTAHGRMLLGLLAGASLGALAHAWAPGAALDAVVHNVSQPVGQIFLRLLFMLVIPLVFAGLALGVSGLGDLRRLGRIGLKTLACTLLLSTIAVGIGLTLVNTVQPGAGVPAEARAALTADAASRASGLATARAPESGWSLLIGIVPDNPIRAAANGDMLAVMFFALMIGVGLTLTRTDAARRFEEAIEGLYDVTMRLISVVIGLAPFGVAALLFTLTAQIGYSVLLLLARYTLLVIGALALH